MVLAGAHLAAKDPIEEPLSHAGEEDLIEFT
jgi:hypothetical protein